MLTVSIQWKTPPHLNSNKKITLSPEFISTQLNTCVCVANNNAYEDDDDDKGDDDDDN